MTDLSNILRPTNLDEFIGRDGPDAPGWYRTRVLPRLLFDAFAQTAQEFH